MRHRPISAYLHDPSPDPTTLGRRGEARAALAEAGAMVRQARLLMVPRLQRRTPMPGETPAVVLVHGFMAGARVFDPLRRRIEEELELDAVAFGYGSLSTFDRTLGRLSQFIDRVVPPERSLVLLGHSLGGVLSRSYSARPTSRPVRRVITVSTPHRGTEAAAIAPGGLGASIRPGSDVVRSLDNMRAAPMHVIGGALDKTVPAASALAGGPTVIARDLVPGVGHNAILYKRHAMDVILQAVDDAARGSDRGE